VPKTISEELFEAFCAECGIGCDPIPCTSELTCDYELSVSGNRVIAEVKQLDPTREDQVHVRGVEAGRVETYGDKPGRRIRRQIDAAKKQIKRQTRGILPGLLVIFNNVPFLRSLTDPMFVMMAMYGQLAALLEVPEDPSESPRVLGSVRTGDRRMTKEHNTSISAVCILQEGSDGIKYLTFYHNVFAAQAFEPDWLRLPNVKHYTIRDPESGRFEKWVAA
jgi:hypothetical protein